MTTTAMTTTIIVIRAIDYDDDY